MMISEIARGDGPSYAVINGIDTAHRSLASLFFDDVRDESGCARDHENAVERCGIHSQIGENGPDRAIYISTARAACICTPLTAASRASSNRHAVRGSLAWRRSPFPNVLETTRASFLALRQFTNRFANSRL